MEPPVNTQTSIFVRCLASHQSTALELKRTSEWESCYLDRGLVDNWPVNKAVAAYGGARTGADSTE